MCMRAHVRVQTSLYNSTIQAKQRHSTKKIIGPRSDAKSFHLEKITCLPSPDSPPVTLSSFPLSSSHFVPFVMSRSHAKVERGEVPSNISTLTFVQSGLFNVRLTFDTLLFLLCCFSHLVTQSVAFPLIAAILGPPPSAGSVH